MGRERWIQPGCPPRALSPEGRSDESRPFVASELVRVARNVIRYGEEFRKALAKTPKLYDLLSARFDFVVH